MKPEKPDPRQLDIEDAIRAATDAPEQPVEKRLTRERQAAYGHPLDNFCDAHTIKAVTDKCKDPAVRHALEMIWLKVVRLVETPAHQDSIDDIKGYAETINMIHAERKRRGTPL